MSENKQQPAEVLADATKVAMLMEMAAYYKAAAIRFAQIALREQRRFYISVACNVVLLGTIWVAL